MTIEKHFVFALCMAAMNLFTAKHAFKVYLYPQNKAKHINERFELICAVPGCSQEINFIWATPMDSSTGGKSKTNQTVSRLEFNKLSIEHNKEIICKAGCGSYKENKTRIRIYSFPTDPVISRMDSLRLQCAIHNVYPPPAFKIEWLRGDETISDSYGPTYSEEVVRDVYSNYTLTEQDLGKNITCKVTLNMDGIPEDRAVRSATVQYGPAFIAISNHTTVRLGEHLKLRCDTDMESHIMWTKLGKSGAVALGKDRELVFERADWSVAGEYECEASATLGSRRSKVNVTVLGPPNVPKIRLSQTTDPKEGDNITIFCDADGVPSLVHLTISGTSLNHSEKPSSDQAYMSINIPSVQLKDSGLYHCEAHNEFGSKSSSINITVQERPSVAPNLPTVIVPTVSSVSLLGAAAVLIRFLRRFKKTSQDIAIQALNI